MPHLTSLVYAQKSPCRILGVLDQFDQGSICDLGELYFDNGRRAKGWLETPFDTLGTHDGGEIALAWGLAACRHWKAF